jgi:hypothetical protein
MKISCGTIGAAIVGGISVLGPGAMIALLWWWREEIWPGMNDEDLKGDQKLSFCEKASKMPELVIAEKP